KLSPPHLPPRPTCPRKLYLLLSRLTLWRKSVPRRERRGLRQRLKRNTRSSRSTSSKTTSSIDFPLRANRSEPSQLLKAGVGQNFLARNCRDAAPGHRFPNLLASDTLLLSERKHNGDLRKKLSAFCGREAGTRPARPITAAGLPR